MSHEQRPIQTSGVATSNNPTDNSNANSIGESIGHNAGDGLLAYNLETISSGNVVANPSNNTPAQPVVLAVPSPNAITRDHTTTLNNQAILQLSHGFSIASPTVTPGAALNKHFNTIISYDSSALAVGTDSLTFASSLAIPIITVIANQVITAVPNAITLPGTTMTPGDPNTAIIGGTNLAFDTAGRLVVNAKTTPLQSSKPIPFTTTIGNRVITAIPVAVIISGTTLVPSDLGVIFHGSVVAADSAGQLIVDSQTTSLPTSTQQLITTIGGQAIIATSAAPTIPSTTRSAEDVGPFESKGLMAVRRCCVY